MEIIKTIAQCVIALGCFGLFIMCIINEAGNYIRAKRDAKLQEKIAKDTEIIDLKLKINSLEEKIQNRR